MVEGEGAVDDVIGANARELLNARLEVDKSVWVVYKVWGCVCGGACGAGSVQGVSV